MGHYCITSTPMMDGGRVLRNAAAHLPREEVP